MILPNGVIVADPNDELEQRSEKRWVSTVFEFLTSRQREVMLLGLAGYTNEEIARLLGIGAECVKSHKLRAAETIQTAYLSTEAIAQRRQDAGIKTKMHGIWPIRVWEQDPLVPKTRPEYPYEKYERAYRAANGRQWFNRMLRYGS